MEWFEEHAIENFLFEIKLGRRHMDDTMVILCMSILEEFTQHINSIHPIIQFTREEEADSIAMLDTYIKRNQGGHHSFLVYRKSTHTDHFYSLPVANLYNTK